MDPAIELAIVLLGLNFLAVVALGVIVDARARRRDASTRALIAGIEARVAAKVTVHVDGALRALVAERVTPTSLPPPTLQ